MSGAKTKTWHSRIVGHGEENPAQLLANPFNFRVHPRRQQEALQGAIEEIGYLRSVTVNQRTGHIVDGHMRVMLALARNEPLIPVEYVDLSEHEERLALATLDPIAAQAATDREHLDALLRDIDTASPTLQRELDALAQKAGLVPGEPVERQPLFPGGSVAPLPSLSPEDADGADPSSGLDGNRASARKEKTAIVLTYAPDAYPLVLARLDAVRETAGLDDNRDALLLLLDEWESANDAAVPY